MPRKPTSACPVCRRKHCTDPTHVRKPFQGAVNYRPGYNSAAQIRRRKATVDAWRVQYGDWCPECGAVDYHEDGVPVKLTADHVIPVKLGGSEDGPLTVKCLRCQRSQGARVANRGRAR